MINNKRNKNLQKQNDVENVIKNEIESVQMTIGELIEAISQISLGICEDKEEAYRLTSRRVSEILSQNKKDIEIMI